MHEAYEHNKTMREHQNKVSQSELIKALGGDKHNLDSLEPETLRYMVTDLMATLEAAETLRDRFAMAALQGMMQYHQVFKDMAADAYKIADAMLEARK